jgi:hypothetical protein
MWIIVGEDRKTGKTVEVATADNETEKKMILQEEARNYKDLRAVGMTSREPRRRGS